MTPRLVAHATGICRLSSRREKKTSIFFTVDTCLWFVFTAVAVTTGTMCRDTRVCAGASPGCVGVHHRDARPRRAARAPRPGTSLRPILTSPNGGDLRVDGSECRLQSSVVLFILHLLRFCFLSLVCAVALLAEKESTGATLGDRPGEPRFHV